MTPLNINLSQPLVLMHSGISICPNFSNSVIC